MDYVWYTPLTALWRSQRSLLFSLSLSDGMRSVRKLAILRLWESRIACGTSLLLFSLFPKLIVIWGPLSAAFLSPYLWTWVAAGHAAKRVRNLSWRVYGGQTAVGDQLLLAARATPAFAIFTILVEMLLSNFKSGVSDTPPVDALVKSMTMPFELTIAFTIFIPPAALLLLVPWSAYVSKRLRMRAKSLTWLWAVLAVLGVSVGVGWLMQYVPAWVQEMFVWIMGLLYFVAFVNIARQVVRSTVRSIHDWREFKRLPSLTAMSRSDIEGILRRFTTNTYRRKFVRWLADRRIVPTGKWPPGFSLSDRSDPAVTDLARLEERWLGLDR